MVRQARLNYEELDLGPKWTVQCTILRRLGQRWVKTRIPPFWAYVSFAE
jgi:hypothetical protein